MHLLFIDDSGSISKDEHFVLGGLVIPEEQWSNLEKDFTQICKTFRIQGEVKWRFFGQKNGREDKSNTLTHLSIVERDELRRSLLITISKYNSVKIIATVVHLPTIYSSIQPLEVSSDFVYSLAYKPLTERFQYYLQDLSRTTGSHFNGIVVCDHRNPNQDRILRSFHDGLLKSDTPWKSRYSNLIEHLFFSPSHYSIGLQLADLISGAIYRYFEHEDARWYELVKNSFRKDSKGMIEGFGLIRVPKRERKENDAESGSYPEPAIMTQSQRTFDGT